MSCFACRSKTAIFVISIYKGLACFNDTDSICFGKVIFVVKYVMLEILNLQDGYFIKTS